MPEETLEELYDHLVQASVIEDIRNLQPASDLFSFGRTETDVEPLSQTQARRIIQHAAALSTSTDPRQQDRAYDIANRIRKAMVTKDDMLVLAAADYIMGKLGWFPSREIHHQRFKDATNQNFPRLPFWMDLEVAMHQDRNRLNLQDGSLTLTDFQYGWWRHLRQRKPTAFSAPTSAGKSFVLERFVAEVVLQARACVVYVVPTKALVRQVSQKIGQLIRTRNNRIPVRIAPVPIPLDQASNGAVFVFTQERLLAMTTAITNEMATPNLLIVDEAQEVSTPGRGVILEQAVQRAAALWPEMVVHFASPRVENPGILLDDVLHRSGHAHEEVRSPVSQNVILVSNEPNTLNENALQDETNGARQSYAWFSLARDGKFYPLGKRHLGQPIPTTDMDVKARLAAHVRTDDCVIIYCNAPAAAHQAANALMDRVPELPEHELEKMGPIIEAVAKGIHPRFELVEFLRKGIGIHYGAIPSNIRRLVEDAARDGLIRYLCSTSTLLQGINLPTRNIIMLKPTKGSKQPLLNHDFLNLAGRSGRMGRDFHGNVWVVEPESWQVKSYMARGNAPISTAFSKGVEGVATVVTDFIDTATKLDPDSYKRATVSGPFIGKILQDARRQQKAPGEILKAAGVDESNLFAASEKLESVLAALSSVDPSVLDAHPTVYPGFIKRLHDYLDEQEDLGAFVPRSKHREDPYEFLNLVMEPIRRELHGEQSKLFRRDAYLGTYWMQGTPLNVLINRHLSKYHRGAHGPKLQKAIRDFLKDLEKRVKFEMAQDLRIHHDVVESIVRRRLANDELDPGTARQYEALLADLTPLHLFLEFGTNDQLTVDLISLGLMRSTALKLADRRRLWSETQEYAQAEDLLKDLEGVRAAHVKAMQLEGEEILDLAVLLGKKESDLAGGL